MNNFDTFGHINNHHIDLLTTTYFLVIDLPTYLLTTIFF